MSTIEEVNTGPDAGVGDSKPHSVEDDCAYFDNKPLTELFGLLSGSKEKISQQLQLLMIRESIYAARFLSRDAEEMRLETFEMVAVYQQIRQEIQELVIIDYFYTNLTSMFQELSTSIPACEKMTINELTTIITSGQKGGMNLAKLIQSFLVSLFIFLAFLSGKIDANKSDGDVSQEAFYENKPRLDKIFSIDVESKELVPSNNGELARVDNGSQSDAQNSIMVATPSSAELEIITPGILAKKSMQEAIVQGVVWEVVATISASEDKNINDLAKKSNLSFAVKEIGKTGVSGENIKKLGLTLNEQKNVLSLYNVAYNNWDLVINQQVAELSRILTDCDAAYQSLQLEFSSSMINYIDGLEPKKTQDQEMLKAMGVGLRKFLLGNGFVETNGELVLYNSGNGESQQPLEESNESDQESNEIAIPNVAKETKRGSVVWTAAAQTWRTLQSNIEYFAGQSAAELVSAAKDAVIPTSIQKEAANAEQLENEAAKQLEQREKEKQIEKTRQEIALKKNIANAREIKLALTDGLNNLSASASSIISPVHYEYSPDTKIISIHYDNNAILFRVSLLRFYKEVIISPKLEELKGLIQGDKANYFSQLTVEQKNDYQRALSLADRITYTQFALTQEAGAIMAASYNGSNYDLLKITTTRIGSALAALEIAGNTTRPMRSLEDSQNSLITREETDRLKKAGDDYWKAIKDRSTDPLRGLMGAVRGIVNVAAYETSMVWLEGLGGPLDALVEYYNTHPTNCIIIASVSGIILVGFGLTITSPFWIGPATGVATATTTALRGSVSVISTTLNMVTKPIIFIMGSIVGASAIQEVILRGPELIGFQQIPKLTSPEERLNWVIIKILEFSGIDSPCGEGGTCISPPDRSTLWSVLIFGGLVLIFYKDKIIAYGKTNASRQPAIAAVPGAASGRRGGDLTTPARRFLLNGEPNPASIPSGGYTKHKVRKSSNKNRKANKTKKPRRTLQKNKKSKHNSSQKKNKNKKTKTKKHKRTIRHK